MSGTQSECPNAETIAAFVEGGLEPAERRLVESHLAACDVCIHLAGEAAAWQRVEPAAQRFRRRLAPRWGVIAAALAVLVTAVSVITWRESTDPRARLITLARRVDNRLVESRLDRFPYRPPAGPSRSAAKVIDAGSLRLRAAAAELARTTAPVPGPEELHLRGVALLLAGDPASAAQTLRLAAERRANDPNVWSDLAAAEWAASEGSTGRDAQAIVRALAAADYALSLDSRHEAALFNRALAIESLHLIPNARVAWDAYLRVEHDGDWVREAEARRARLAITTQMQVWEADRPRLERAAAERDIETVRQIVARHRQHARAWSEVQVLNDWAAAYLSGDASRAAERLALARTVGGALASINGETLLRDAVGAIEAATPDRARIARAHRDYYDARVLHSRQKTVEALPLFARSRDEFERARSPMAHVAEYYIAICRHAAGANDASLEILSRILADAPPYTALRAQVLWQRGTNFSRAGRFIESLDAQRASLALFEKLGESFSASHMRNQIAATEAALGRAGEAWRMRLEIFRSLSESGDGGGLQAAVEAAARTEALAQRWDTAHSLLTLALDPQLKTNHWLYVNSLLWRGLTAHRLGRHAAAVDDLARARIATTSVDAAGFREEALNELRFAEAVVMRERDPARAIALLDQYIAGATRAENPFLLPEALLERGRAMQVLGDDGAAIRDFAEALARLAERRGVEGQYHDAFFATGDSATRELIDLLDRRGDAERAFMVAEQALARSIADRLQHGRSMPVSSSAAVRRLIPAGTIVVRYVVLDDRIVIFSLDRTAMHVARVNVRRSALLDQTRALATLIRDDRDAQALVHAERLYDWLIAPLQDRLSRSSVLVVVPDPLLARIPFSAFRDRRSRTYVIDTVSVVMAPSATVYAMLLSRPPRDRRAGTTLIVGNPAIDRAAFPTLAELPAAGREAALVAREYADATVLRGSAATRELVLERLASSSVIHIASHAVVVEAEPSRSFLVMTPAGHDSGALYLHEIAQQTLARTDIVVLAGCRTSGVAGDGDITSFALAFLAAGSRNTVGTLWDVGDQAAGDFSTRFHRALQSGASPAAALRDVQRLLLRSSAPELSGLRTWSAFQVVGTGF